MEASGRYPIDCDSRGGEPMRRRKQSELRVGCDRLSPFTCHLSPASSLPFICIPRFINPVGGIHNVFGWTPELDESVGQKRFAIDPDTGFIGIKDYRDYFVAATQGRAYQHLLSRPGVAGFQSVT